MDFIDDTYSIHSRFHVQTNLYSDKHSNTNIQVTNPDLEDIFPRLGFYDDHIARVYAIIDNLDEVLMLPQGMIFPRCFEPKKEMSRRVSKLSNTDGFLFGRPPRSQEEQYDEFELYTEDGYLIH